MIPATNVCLSLFLFFRFEGRCFTYPFRRRLVRVVIVDSLRASAVTYCVAKVDKLLDDCLNEIDTVQSVEKQEFTGYVHGHNASALERTLSNKLVLKGRLLREAQHAGALCSGRGTDGAEIRARASATRTAWCTMGVFLVFPNALQG